MIDFDPNTAYSLFNTTPINPFEKSGNPLLFAAKKGSLEGVQKAIQQGFDANSIDQQGKTALYFATRLRDFNIVSYLLKKGANPNKGIPPLHCTAQRGYLFIARALLEQGGADVNTRGKSDKSALNFAVRYNQSDMVKYLLKFKPNLESKDKNEHTPLFFSTYNGDEVMTKLLLDHGANVHARDKKGNTPLHYAARNNNIACMSLLLSRGAQVDEKGENYKTPFLFAVQNGSLDAAYFLLQSGANPHAKDNNKNGALHLAARHGQKEMASWLICTHLYINGKNNNNDTPLHLAAAYGNEQIAKILLQHKADPTICNKQSLSALALAIINEKTEVIKLFLKHGKNHKIWPHRRNLLYFACLNKKDSNEVTKLIIDFFPNVNVRDEISGWAPLHLAVSRRDKSLAVLLITEDADVNITTMKTNYTPLMIAATRGFEKLTRILANEQFINLDWKGGFTYNQTALSIAAAHGNIEIFKLLVKKGAKVDKAMTRNKQLKKLIKECKQK